MAHRAVLQSHQSRWKFFGDAEDDAPDLVRSILLSRPLRLRTERESREDSIHGGDAGSDSDCNERDDLAGQTERGATDDRVDDAVRWK